MTSGGQSDTEEDFYHSCDDLRRKKSPEVEVLVSVYPCELGHIGLHTHTLHKCCVSAATAT